MKIPLFIRRESQAGFALLMVMVMLAISFLILGATMARTTTNTKLIDRNTAYIASTTAAEAATEKALALLMSDYQQGAEALILSNLSVYQSAVPSSSESSFWTNFQFSDAQGHTGKTYVGRNSAATNAAFIQLAEQYAGLSGFSSTYRILSNVKPLNSPYNVTAAVQQDVQVAEIPVFQFAIFYNGLMEYTWCAPFTVTGRVHCNSNIYVGSSSALTFNYEVTCSGVITNPAWDGQTPPYSGAVNYNGTPTPGYDTGYSTLTLPIGVTNTPAAVREIINLPATNESVSSAVGEQRYYNKAGMVILVSDTNIVVTVKDSPTDATPISFTNGTLLWTNAAFTNFINTTNFYDQRESQTMKTTQIDVGQLKTWMASTNFNVGSLSTKFSSVPLNIIYVDDLRSTNATTNTAVRLVNAQTLPTNGLTVATINPLYILGNYNCPSNAFLGTTNTSASAPASLVSDAITILSSQWADSKSAGTYGNRNNPVDTTINTAIIAGIVYSTGSTATTFSGGVMNLPRLLENWSGHTLTMNTSIVNLYNSVRATHQFQAPNIYYNAPTRNWNFDQNFTSAGKLPPGTPLIRRLLRSSFCNPPPNTTTYNATNDYVPQ